MITTFELINVNETNEFEIQVSGDTVSLGYLSKYFNPHYGLIFWRKISNNSSLAFDLDFFLEKFRQVTFKFNNLNRIFKFLLEHFLVKLKRRREAVRIDSTFGTRSRENGYEKWPTYNKIFQ